MAQLAVGGRCGARCRRGKRGPCERGVTHGCLGGTGEWRFRGALQLELVHWQTAQISAHLQAHRGGCGIGRDHAHAPNHARVLAGRWRRRWVRRWGDAWRTCGQNASTAEGVPARRSSRGGINKWTCSLPHETVFCVGGGEGGPSFFTSPVRFVCGAVVPGGASSSSRERCADLSATSLGQLRPSGVRHLEVEVDHTVRLGKVVELLQAHHWQRRLP